MATPQTGSISYDIAARQAHVVGSKPRIAPLPDDGISAEARELVNVVRAGAGAGPATVIPEYMRLMLKHPEIFKTHMEMGTVLYNGRLSPRDRELAILRCGWLCRAPYEWGEHVDIAKRIGLSAADVARVTEGSSAPGWSEHDSAVLRGVEELIADQALSDATWNVLAAAWDDARLIEYLMVVGQYQALACVQNTLRVQLAPNNPGMTHR